MHEPSNSGKQSQRQGLFFEILRAQTLYRGTNLQTVAKCNMMALGPTIEGSTPVFHFDNTKEEDDEDGFDDTHDVIDRDYIVDSDIGKVIESE